MFNFPFEPKPEGILVKIVFKRFGNTPLISLRYKLVRRRRTPQFISYPTPPGEIIPVSASVPATPPMQNPYP
ncbi:hypothetical protein ES703_94652 [subsurface metagenome]